MICGDCWYDSMLKLVGNREVTITVFANNIYQLRCSVLKVARANIKKVLSLFLHCIWIICHQRYYVSVQAGSMPNWKRLWHTVETLLHQEHSSNSIIKLRKGNKLVVVPSQKWKYPGLRLHASNNRCAKYHKSKTMCEHSTNRRMCVF